MRVMVSGTVVPVSLRVHWWAARQPQKHKQEAENYMAHDRFGGRLLFDSPKAYLLMREPRINGRFCFSNCVASGEHVLRATP